MAEDKDLTYFAKSNTCDLKNNFDWTPYQSLSIRNIVKEESEIRIEYGDSEYEGKVITINIYQADIRDIKQMDATRCYRPAAGCCLDHCGCGYEQCLEHYPLQKVTVECDIEQLRGQRLVGFELKEDDYYSYAYHEFNFVLSDERKIPFEITNSSHADGFTLILRADEY
jgi:hypothetical protein